MKTPVASIVLFLLSLVFVVPVVPVDAAQPALPSLGKSLPEYRLVRCLFAEQRLVVEYHDKLYVVHEGERLPESSTSVIEISKNRVVLSLGKTVRHIDEPAVAMPDRMVIISSDGKGGLAKKEFMSKAEAVRAGELSSDAAAVSLGEDSTTEDPE